MSQPQVPHLNALHHLLRYLKSSPGQGLLFSFFSQLRLMAYADAEWANCPDTWCSITGYCVFLDYSLVLWNSKKQPNVSRSSIEAEYQALAAMASEISQLQALLKDSEVQLDFSIMFCDSQSTIYMSTNPTFHEHSEHVEIEYYFIRERVASGLNKLKHVKSQHQLVDLLTKLAFASQF